MGALPEVEGDRPPYRVEVGQILAETVPLLGKGLAVPQKPDQVASTSSSMSAPSWNVGGGGGRTDCWGGKR